MDNKRTEILHVVLLQVLIYAILNQEAQAKSCRAGYSTTKKAQVTSFPPETVKLGSRTTIECAILCRAAVNCVQLYYDSSTGGCYIISVSTPLLTSSSSAGLVFSDLNNGNTGCSNTECSQDAFCIYDSSPTFGGAMCTADNSNGPQDTHVMSEQHYYWASPEDHRDNGVVYTVNFNKTRDDTALRVMWFGTTRAHYHAPGSCGRYYVLFNGSQCTNPNNIDFTNYDASSVNHHQFSELDGICNGLPSGGATVSIAVGSCPSFGWTDIHTGWRASASMWVYEMTSTNNSDSSQCSSLPVINTQYQTILNMLSDLDPESSLMFTTYNKIFFDTILRVKWQGTARVLVPYEARWCARWYITVDGVECNPKAEFVLGMYANTATYARDNQKTRTLEGFCYGILPGSHNIELRVGVCNDDPGESNTFTGCSTSVSRLTISEVRIETTTQSITATNGRVQKLPFFNLKHWWWYRINNNEDNALIVQTTYAKVSSTSGLHLRAVGSATVQGGSYCCRWYFTINGTECTRPGAIEGIAYKDNSAVYRSPGVIDGVCYGYLSGTYFIGFHVGTCYAFANGDCSTGWGSTLQVIVEEAQPDRSSNCLNFQSCT